MKKTFVILFVAVSTILPAFAQVPSSLAGLTYRDQFLLLGVKAIPSNYTEALDLLADGTFVSRFELFVGYQNVSALPGSSGGTPLITYLPMSTGTYTFVQNSMTSGTLTLNGTSNPGTFTLSFSSASQGNSTRGSGSKSFTLMPTGGDSSARGLINMSTLVSAKQGSPISFGFVVGGTTPLREIFIRAVGPSLAQFGVTNFAVNPGYTINGLGFEPPGAFGSSQPPVGWSASATTTAIISAESARAGAFPLVQGSNDKADVVLLAPGAYSITVNPTDASGEGAELIEVYEVE